jgi:hypothetical protein
MLEIFLLNIKFCLKNNRFKLFDIAICHNDNNCRKYRLFCIFLSYLFIIIEDNDDCIYSMKKSNATFRNNEI